jgi:hypothetical protein
MTHHWVEKQNTQSSPTRKAIEAKRPPSVATNAPSTQALIQRTLVDPRQLTKADAAQLQQTIGNRAVGQLLSNAARAGTGRAPALQTKLQVGPVDDKYEREADKVADSVMRSMANPTLQRQAAEQTALLSRRFVQRRSRQEMAQSPGVGSKGGAIGGEFESTLQRARTGGQPVAAGLRTHMERGLGADFGDVRVHTDAQADQLSRAVSARAFTTGRDIFFRHGEYNPGSSGGQRLVAHELTHVVQQGAAPQNIQRKDKKATANDIPTLEQGLTPNSQTVGDDIPSQYKVTVAVARVAPEYIPMAKERMKSTIRNKARAKARSIPLLKNFVRKEKSSDAIKTKSAKKAVEKVKQSQGAQDANATLQEIQDAIANSNSTGHSWIKFSSLNDNGEAIKTYSFGFYSSQAPARPTDVVQGEVNNPDTNFEENQETRFLDTRVSAAKYAQGLARAVKLKANPPAYTTIGYNCTKFVKDVATAAGATFPSGAGMMIPFSNAGQVRLFQKALAPNLLFDKIGQSDEGYETSPEKEKLGSGDFKSDPMTGQIIAMTQQQRQQRVERTIKDNAESIGVIDKQEWLQMGVTSDKLEDLDGATILDLVASEVDIVALFETFELPVPQAALIAPGKTGMIVTSFTAETLATHRTQNVPAGRQVRVREIDDEDIIFEVAREGAYRKEFSEFVKYVNFGG